MFFIDYRMRMFFKILFFACLILISSNADLLSNNDEDKLVLSPLELMSMIIKERSNNHEVWSAPPAPATRSLARRPSRESVVTVAEQNDDEDALKRRKVWSRWGKWGECSVTCGSGVRSRQRQCAGGRCAHGELQMQQRPCARPPCGSSRQEPHDAE